MLLIPCCLRLVARAQHVKKSATTLHVMPADPKQLKAAIKEVLNSIMDAFSLMAYLVVLDVARQPLINADCPLCCMRSRAASVRCVLLYFSLLILILILID